MEKRIEWLKVCSYKEKMHICLDLIHVIIFKSSIFSSLPVDTIPAGMV